MAYLKFNYFSDSLGYCTQLDVILPQPFPAQGKKYPVLYLLHGLSDDNTIWCRRTSIERYADEKGIAVVMPNVLKSFYTDMWKGDKYFTFVAEEVPQVVKSVFPITCDPGQTYVAGLSMGGYGAFKLALTHPGRYAAAGSFSGAVDMGGRLWDSDSQLSATMENIFGPLDRISGSSNDLLHLCEEVAAGGKCPRLYQWCGTEDFLYQNNLTFKNKALSLGLPLIYQEGPGDHQWKYWDVCIQKFLEFINKE